MHVMYAIYAILLRNLFCRDLRAYVWRKIEPKIVPVEKKRQISGMQLTFGIILALLINHQTGKTPNLTFEALPSSFP